MFIIQEYNDSFWESAVVVLVKHRSHDPCCREYGATFIRKAHVCLNGGQKFLLGVSGGGTSQTSLTRSHVVASMELQTDTEDACLFKWRTTTPSGSQRWYCSMQLGLETTLRRKKM